MKTAGWWWNGLFGRVARRDVWLKRDGDRWRVEARRGDGNCEVWGRDFDDEAKARFLLDDILARGSDHWRDLSHL